MNDKLIRFIDNLNGQWIEVSDRTNSSQCMDLVYAFIFCLDIPKATIQHLYAYQAYTEATDFTRQYFDLIPNLIDTVPQAGDLVVWKSGTYGHIAIVIEATQLKMKVFEQNKPLGSNAHVADETYTNCLGFLRPKFTVQEGIPQWLKTIFQESGMSFETGESLFRELWGKALKYDDDTKSLQAQVVSANEALSDRAMEVSVLTEKNQKLSDKIAEVEEQLNKIRSERDTLDVEKTRLSDEVGVLLQKVAYLEAQVAILKSNKPLMGYTWAERFASLWRR